MEYAAPVERNARLQDLVSLLTSIPKENFDSFDIYKATYESAGRAIGVDIMVPKKKPTSASNPRPVMVRIHGGFLITGSSLFPAWFSKWILDYAEAHYAVIISPDYRLLPEARGTDILRDMEAFWMWFESGGPYQQLRGVGREEISLDRDKLLLLGESAGGYLSTQSILSGYVWPRAMIALYPMLDMKADHYTKEYPKPIVNVPNFPMSVVDDALASMPMQKPITEADPPARLDIALASVQTGRFLEFLGTEPELFVLDRLKEGQYSVSPGESIFPPLLIFHGEQDSAVPVEGSRRFLKIVEEIDCRHEHRAVFRQGDHGFDAGATLQDEWLHEGLEWISAKWLENRSRL